MWFLTALKKRIQLLELQILLQDATIRELAVSVGQVIDHFETDELLPEYDKFKLKEILYIHQGNLMELKAQKALYAGTAPIELINRIKHTEREIEKLEIVIYNLDNPN